MVLGCVFSPIQTAASPISRQQAQQNARIFLQQRGKSVVMSSLRYAPRHDRIEPVQPYYVFNVGDNEGYVIASGDDRTRAVLGYADTGSFDDNAIPCNLQWWLDEYARQIRFVQEHGSASSRSPKKSVYPEIPVMLTSKWNQSDPYNLCCPLDKNGYRCVTGCGATAMAQLMYYHRGRSVSRTTHEIPAYVTLAQGLNIEPVPAGSVIDWDNMIDSYTTGMGVTEEQKYAVADLMKYCGASIRTDYSRSSSSSRTSDLVWGLVAYFNYSSKTALTRRNDSGLTDEEWDALIYSELSNSRPVLYSGGNVSGDGHVFVCDGYDGQGYFHINWGWGGYQGYYLLSPIDSDDPNLLMYRYNQDVLIHTEPRDVLPSMDDGILFADPVARAVCLCSGDVNDDGVLSEEEAAAVTELGDFRMTGISLFDEFRFFVGLDSIPHNMFDGCSELSSIVLPDNINAIGSNAFLNCKSLSNITIPGSVTRIDQYPFTGCVNLKDMVWNALNCSFSAQYVIPTSVERLTVGDGVVEIPNNFARTSHVKTLTLGKSVSSIGSYAFYKSSGLKSLVLPESVKLIGQYAFYECTGITELSIGDSLATISSRAFGRCKGLTGLTIPKSVTYVGQAAFYQCTGLTDVTLAGAPYIDQIAFGGCDSLKTLTCLSPEPFSVSSTAFQGLYGTVVLRVPIEAVDRYKTASQWSRFSNIVGLDPSSGDVNLDEEVNIADLNCIISSILTPGDDCLMDFMGDINRDGEVNIADINALIDIILGTTH